MASETVASANALAFLQDRVAVLEAQVLTTAQLLDRTTALLDRALDDGLLPRHHPKVDRLESATQGEAACPNETP